MNHTNAKSTYTPLEAYLDTHTGGLDAYLEKATKHLSMREVAARLSRNPHNVSVHRNTIYRIMRRRGLGFYRDIWGDAS